MKRRSLGQNASQIHCVMKFLPFILLSQIYSNPSVALKSDQIRKLKKMNKMPNFDQSFIGYLLEAVFDDEILKNIPIGDKAPHLALDATKL